MTHNMQEKVWARNNVIKTFKRFFKKPHDDNKEVVSDWELIVTGRVIA